MATSVPLEDRPEHLGRRGSRLWDRITGTCALRPDELEILEDACREVDTVDRLERAMRKASLTVTGPYGGKAANPLLAELRQHRAAAATLMGKLKLQDADVQGESRSSVARRAAHARWQRPA